MACPLSAATVAAAPERNNVGRASTVLEMMPDRADSEAVPPREHSQCHRLTIYFNHAINDAVVLLLALGRPPDVARRVIAVGIDAVQTVRCSGTTTDIQQERSVGTPPCITHLDSTPTVVMKSALCRVIAAAEHVLPSHIFRRSRLGFAVNWYVVAVRSVRARHAQLYQFGTLHHWSKP